MTLNARILLFYCVYLCQYIRSFVFPEMAGRWGATAPLNPPLGTYIYISILQHNSSSVATFPAKSPYMSHYRIIIMGKL